MFSTRVHQQWIGYIISVSAVVATTSVLLVFQLGQPRIWMSMSRDGLLPKAFGKIHPKFNTPWFSTIITGIIVAVPSLFMGSGLMTQLTSIGTLFAFVLVSGGVSGPAADLSSKEEGLSDALWNGRYIMSVLYILFILLFLGRRLRDDLRHIAHDSGLQEILFLIFSLLVDLVDAGDRRPKIIPPSLFWGCCFAPIC